LFHGGEIVHALQEDGAAYYVLHVRSSGFQDCGNVSEHTIRLQLYSASDHFVRRRINWDLASEENESICAHSL
jgi:hypothetical protein